MLLFAENEVNGPATAVVRPRSAEVRQEVRVVATGFLQGIGEDGKATPVPFATRQVALVVSGPGQCPDGRRSPGRVEGDPTEGVAEDFTQQSSLGVRVGGLMGGVPG